jgi:GAF domain-containing protein
LFHGRHVPPRPEGQDRVSGVGPEQSDDSSPHDEHDLCRPFLDALPINGASLTVIASSGIQISLCSSDSVAARIDELHFELGEGPQWEATRSGQIVVIPDVRLDGHDSWPIFGAALTQISVGALSCVPLRMGAVTVGVATLYSDEPGELNYEQRTTAFAIASAIAGSAVERAMVSAGHDTGLETVSAPALRREVHQATGMILVQLNTTATIAYSRLQAYAFANGRTVQAVARDVVAGALTFNDDSP